MGNGVSVTSRDDLKASVLEIESIDRDIKALHLLTHATEHLGDVPKKDNVEVRVDIISRVFDVVSQVYGYAQAIYKLMERLLEELEKMKDILTREIEARVEELQEKNRTLEQTYGDHYQTDGNRVGPVVAAVGTLLGQNRTLGKTSGGRYQTGTLSGQENMGTDERTMKHLLGLEKLKKQMAELEKLTLSTEELLGKIRNSAGISTNERAKLLDTVHELKRIENMVITEEQYLQKKREEAKIRMKLEKEKREKEANEKRLLEKEDRIRREKAEKELRKREAEELAKKNKEEMRQKVRLAREREEERRKREAEAQQNKKEEMERQRLQAAENARIKEEKEKIRRAAAEEARIEEEKQRKIQNEIERQRLVAENERKKQEAEEAAKIMAEEERKRHEAEEEERIKQEAERKRLENLQREEEERNRRAAEERAAKKEEKRNKREAEEQKRIQDALKRAENAYEEKLKQELLNKEIEETAKRTADEQKLKENLDLAKKEALKIAENAYEEKLKQELLNKELEETAKRRADEQKLKESLELAKKEADELREKQIAMKEKLQQSAVGHFTDAGRSTDITDFQYKSSYTDDEVDHNRAYLKYNKGIGSVFSTVTGALDHEDLVCKTTEEISNEATASITSQDATVISEEVALQKTKADTQPISGRMFIPHRPVNAGSQVSVMGQVDGKRWKAYKSVYPIPTSVDKDIYWAGTEVTFVNTVKLVAITKLNEQHVELNKYGKTVHSIVDNTINLIIPADAFKQPSQLNLGVSVIDKEELQLCKTYHTECEHVLGCSSLVQISLSRPSAKDFEVWIVAKAKIDTKAHGRQYIAFVEDGRSWKQARSEWKEDSHCQVIVIPKGQPTYRVMGVRMAPDTGLKTAQKAVEALHRHSKEIHVSLVLRQSKSALDQCILVCVQTSEMDKKVKELTKHGYSVGGGESGTFCLEDQGVLLVTFSGNVGAPSGSGGKLRLQYEADKAVTAEKITLYVLDPGSQPETHEFSGLLHVVKESQPDITIMSTEIFLPKK